MSDSRIKIYAEFSTWETLSESVKSLINFFMKNASMVFRGDYQGTSFQYMSGNVRNKYYSSFNKTTSQICTKCGHTHKLNRDHKNHCFCCRNCGYRSNDDRIGAMNIYQRGLAFIQDYLNEVNNPSNQDGQVYSDRVQSTTPRCNDSFTEKKSKKKVGSLKKTVCTTDQLQAHPL